MKDNLVFTATYNEVENIVRGGPSEAVCGDTGEKPPYLDDNWWFDI